MGNARSEQQVGGICIGFIAPILEQAAGTPLLPKASMAGSDHLFSGSQQPPGYLSAPQRRKSLAEDGSTHVVVGRAW